METNRRKILTAYIVLSRMAQEPMSSFTAYKLYKLKKALQEEVDFQVQEEKKKVAELGGEFSDAGEHNLQGEQKEAYDAWRTELIDSPFELDRGKVEISMREMKNVSMAQMEALEDFTDWKE